MTTAPSVPPLAESSVRNSATWSFVPHQNWSRTCFTTSNVVWKSGSYTGWSWAQPQTTVSSTMSPHFPTTSFSTTIRLSQPLFPAIAPNLAKPTFFRECSTTKNCHNQHHARSGFSQTGVFIKSHSICLIN